jgi:hypothetical protein
MNGYTFGIGTQFSLGCYFTCTGNVTEYCGGRALIDIYNNLDYVQPPTPSVQPTAIGGYLAKGCYEDNINGVRAVNDVLRLVDPNMTPDLCGQYCSTAGNRYRISGVEYA